jgi:hypothetical protein
MTDENSGPKPSSMSYSSNSQKSKQPEQTEEPRVTGPVISGSAVERKVPLRKKFLSAYTGDSAQSVGSFLVTDVVVPYTKNLISDLVTQGINRLLYGSSRPTGSMIGSVVGSRVSSGYGKFFNGGGAQNQQSQNAQMSAQARANHAFGEIVLNSRSDAEIVIDSLRDLIEQYGNAKVTNLYSLLGITGEFTDQKYGWTNLSRASVIHTREGYVLDLPRPEVLP